MYDYLDKILKRLVIQIYRTFRKYKVMPFDELNVFGGVQDLFLELETANKKAFQQIANHYYDLEPHGDKSLSDMWLDTVLRTPSEVMKYSYDSEATRRRDRLVEALTATKGAVSEYDTAMRYWVQMAGWFAVEVADLALEQAREDDGQEEVKWQSEHDSRVCKKCEKLDGKVFKLVNLPAKPHPNCRCWTVRV